MKCAPRGLHSRARPSGRRSSRRMGTAGQTLARGLENGGRPLATHGRELLEKFVQAVARLKLLEEGLDRDPRPCEDRGPPRNLWIALNQLCSGLHRAPSWSHLPDGTLAALAWLTFAVRSARSAAASVRSWTARYDGKSSSGIPLPSFRARRASATRRRNSGWCSNR